MSLERIPSPPRRYTMAHTREMSLVTMKMRVIPCKQLTIIYNIPNTDPTPSKKFQIVGLKQTKMRRQSFSRIYRGMLVEIYIR